MSLYRINYIQEKPFNLWHLLYPLCVQFIGQSNAYFIKLQKRDLNSERNSILDNSFYVFDTPALEMTLWGRNMLPN
jgi:hypothetical protein